ncbi:MULTISPECIES: restriction endonuclease [Trichocoleus]|uniref:Restriction endonuclease n=1 Tax=Trichocoleus desertorum GB2-A4 TaxID=2933944 RepID=A0ABV0JD62_9CYAN|nr:restriction endonuclease [Trichocoleus sp. FACHB-46]MBD1864234.1 restriction endonuclease [Trichocoleus sp. FACHB-46]
MDDQLKTSLLSRIEQLQDAWEVKWKEAEQRIFDIVEPLLSDGGYQVSYKQRKVGDSGFDISAIREETDDLLPYTLAVEYKHYKKPVGLDVVNAAIGAAITQRINRVILITSSRFTKDALELATRDLPLDLELFGFEELKAWVDRIDVDDQNDTREIQQILSFVSRRFAELVAKNPRCLDELEWRDLERLLSEVFDAIGFSVELTPGSKDGGKDLILQCEVDGNHCTYIVEVKHWRSGSRVGKDATRDFLNVIVHEGHNGGLYLSTYGYTNTAFESLSEIERRTLRFGDEEKIVSLCKTYYKLRSGIWSPPSKLTDVLFDGTE